MPRKQRESQRKLGQFTIIYRDRWQRRDYTKGLSWDEKAMLSQLETFDGITAAGVVRAEPAILAEKHPDRSADDIDAYLASLVKKGAIHRSGSEVFVRTWFLKQPVQLRSEKNIASMVYAINRIGYEDLRGVVAKALFDALLELERVDHTRTDVKIKRQCTALAESHGISLPDALSVDESAA